MKTPRRVLLLWALCAAYISGFLRADDSLGDQLGTIHFTVSGTADAQRHVVRGVKLLHHMMYPEADREFAAASKSDPKCSLAYWGRAMSLLHPLWPDAPNAEEFKQGAAFIEQGLACPPQTDRERAYLEALATYYRDGTPAQHVERLTRLDRAAAQLAEKYPEDFDAVSFAALFHLAPARFQAKDKSHRAQIEAAQQIEKVLANIPDHPGAQHYKIHAYDFPLLADRALEVCDSYSGIAPDVPHALHMPTHIYTRRGLWEKSIEFNLRSAEAAQKLGTAAGALNGHQPHAMDYLAYAYLQRGQYSKAEAVRSQILNFKGPYSHVQPGAMAFAFAAIPARCALEQQHWADAATLPLHEPSSFSWGDAFLHCDSMIRFARAIGAARSGQLELARAEIQELDKLNQQFAGSKRAAYWTSQAQTQLLAARAWVLEGEGKKDEAVAEMKRAAALEASIDKEAVTPGEVIPAGDLLGDLLLECGQPAEALSAFEAVNAASPNRFNTLYGAGLAAERAGDAAKAESYFEQLVTVASAADPNLPRIQHAREYLQQHGGTRERVAAVAP
jgi:tetratricopeptide (TPR) repeat protein